MGEAQNAKMMYTDQIKSVCDFVEKDPGILGSKAHKVMSPEALKGFSAAEREIRNKGYVKTIKTGVEAKQLLDMVDDGSITVTKEEMRKLETASWMGDMASEFLLTENQGLVNYFAKHKYHASSGMCVDAEDFTQDAQIALLNAAKMFDLESGHKFSAYACACMSNEIFSDICRMSGLSLPKEVKTRINIITKKRSELQDRLHREPTLEEIEAAIAEDPDIKQSHKKHLDSEHIELYMIVGDSVVSSFDQPQGAGGEAPLIDTLEDKAACSPFLSTYIGQVNDFCRRQVMKLKPEEREALRIKSQLPDGIEIDEAAATKVRNATMAQFNRLVSSAYDTLMDLFNQADQQYLDDLRLGYA